LNRTRLRAAVLLVVVFVAGAIAGGALAVKLSMHGLTAILEGDPRQALSSLYGAVLGRRLHLTDEQRSAVVRIVDEDHAELARLGRTLYPEMSGMRRRRHARIRALLTPAQQAEFDVMAADYERRRREELDLAPTGPDAAPATGLEREGP
jgi:hypothetical protein